MRRTYPDEMSSSLDSGSLHRTLGLAAVAFYCLGDILGAGIYALVGEVAGRAGSSVPLAFVLALFVAAFTAVSYAELGTRHPRSGAEVFLTGRTFGNETLALLVGYLVLCSGIVSSATVSHAFAGYVGSYRPEVPAELWIALFLVAVAALNFRGIEWSSRTNVVFTVIEASGLLLVIGAGLWFLLSGDQATRSVMPQGRAGWIGVAQGGALAFFAFIGFEDVINVAEEVKSPRRNFPRAIVMALLIAGAIYLLVAWVTVQVLGDARLTASETPLVDVIAVAAPRVPLWTFTVIATFAVANTGLLNSITASRLLYGTARQGLLPRFVGAVFSRTRTPHWAILIVLGLSAVLAFSGSLAFLAGTTAVLLLGVFGIVHACLLTTKIREAVARRHGGGPAEEEEIFRAPVAVPVLGMLSCVALIFWVPRESLLRAGILVALGVVLSILGRRWGEKG